MDAVSLQQPLDVVVDGGVGQDVVSELQRNFGADHLISANTADDLDGRLEVRGLDVVGNFQNDQTFSAGCFADRIGPEMVSLFNQRSNKA